MFRKRVLPDWVAVSQRLSSYKGTTTIYYRMEQAQWADIARLYCQDSLRGFQQVASSRHTEVSFGTPIATAGECYFKRFYLRKRFDLLKQSLRGSRARRSVTRELQLQDFGFNTPKTVCLIEHRRFGAVQQSVLVSETLLGSTSIKALLRDPSWGLVQNRSRKRQLLRALALEVARLHEAGFYHGDMNAGNIFCRIDSKPVFYWLDNERTARYRKLSLRARSHNLTQLNKMQESVSQSDRMYFFKVYVAASGLNSRTAKHIARKVLNATKRNWERNWTV